MNAISKPINNLFDWCLAMVDRGWIVIEPSIHDGYYLKLFPETLEAAYRWNSARYRKDDPEQSSFFISDVILDEHTDPVAATMLRDLIDSEAGKALRDHVATRTIEYHKAHLLKVAPLPEAKRAGGRP